MESKKIYIAPRIELIPLDNEISLALESTPPTGPSEGCLKLPEHFNSDPFRSNIV